MGDVIFVLPFPFDGGSAAVYPIYSKQAVDRSLLFLQALIVTSVNVMTGRCGFQ